MRYIPQAVFSKAHFPGGGVGAGSTRKIYRFFRSDPGGGVGAGSTR